MDLLDDKIKQKIEIIFIGQKLNWAQKLIQERDLDNMISFTGYLPHRQAISHLASADTALLFLAKGDKVAIPGKLYEYLGLGLPVIAAVEKEGACSLLLKSINHAQGVCDPGTPEEIAEKIALAVDKKLPNIGKAEVSVFSRKLHSKRLKLILEEIVGGSG